MPDIHPLDCPAWSALTGRHAAFAIVEGGARRYDPAYGVFAGVERRSPRCLADLAALVAARGDVAMLEAGSAFAAPGLTVASVDAGVQMVAARLERERHAAFDIVSLDDTDAPAMLALATLTQPGPFFARTHRLGDFVGVKVNGHLVAMAGERMKPDGHTEVSGVCTHPDHRGGGLAGALLHHVAQRILDRGETPFLHAYASNQGAIAIYERLGFTLRRPVTMTRLAGR